jgi:hypothetical protein
LFEQRFATGERSRQQQIQNAAFVRCEFACRHVTERYRAIDARLSQRAGMLLAQFVAALA